MSYLLIRCFLLISFFFGMSDSNTLEVYIEGLRSNEGKIAIQLLDDKEEVVASKMGEIEKLKAQIEFDELTPGKRYALRYFHDENENGELDVNFMKIPKEGYGFSNNAKGKMGPPKFEDTLFEFDGSAQKLVIKYLF